MNEKLLNILYKQQAFEYLKKQNITSKHQFQELYGKTSNTYSSQILKQCIRMNRHTGIYRLSFIFSNILAAAILSVAVILLINAWTPSSAPEAPKESPYSLAQDAINDGNSKNARTILESNHIPSNTFAGAIAYSKLYELEKKYDQSADVIITFNTDIMGTQNILKASPLYTRMTELQDMNLSSEEREKFDTCMNACKQSAANLASISTLIENKNYEVALVLCDALKANGSSEYILFDFYHTCYTNLKEYETYALKLIHLANEGIKEKEFSYQLPELTHVKYYLKDVYPHVSLETQKKIDALNID